jgi:hypothetical protein
MNNLGKPGSVINTHKFNKSKTGFWWRECLMEEEHGAG